MHQEQLNRAVDQLSALNEINSSDLKILTERYPYCQSAHILYAKKLHEEQNSAFDKQLQRTSSMVYDRRVLFRLIEKTSIPDTVSAGFDHEEESEYPQKEQFNPVVELQEEKITNDSPAEDFSQPLMIHENTMDEVLEDVIRSSDEESVEIESAAELEIPIQELNQSDETLETDEETGLTEIIDSPAVDEITQEELPYTASDSDQKIEINAVLGDDPIFELPPYNIERELGKLEEDEELKFDFRRESEDEVEGEIEEVAGIEAEVNNEGSELSGVSSFSGWLNKIAGASKARTVQAPKLFRKPQVEEVKPIQTQVVEETKPENEPEVDADEFAGELAKKSIQPDENLVSETYARILFMQGKYARAIEVYQQLSLKKPSKSDYFAAIIEQIKKRK